MSDKVTLKVDEVPHAGGRMKTYRLTINAVDEDGSGHGHRLRGPKYSGFGEGKVLFEQELTKSDRDAIRQYLDLADKTEGPTS